MYMPKLRMWLTGIALAAAVLAAAALMPTRPAAGAAQTAGAGGEPVYLTLKLNGQVVPGESPISSLGRENTIACYFFEQSVTTAREAGSGIATGRRQYQPLLIRKRIDKSSPLLMKALVENQRADGVFKFYRPNPKGDGTEEQFYTVEIKNARITGVHIVSDGDGPPMEEVEFTYQTISWTYTNGGITYQDNWSSQK
jgi:type VI secretion system secreted protein Hcp